MAHLQLNNILRDKALSVAGPRYTYGGGTYTPRAQHRIDELLHEGALRGPSGIQWGLGATFGGSDSDEDYDSDMSDGELMGGNKNNKEAARRNKWIKWLRKFGFESKKTCNSEKVSVLLAKDESSCKETKNCLCKKEKERSCSCKKESSCKKEDTTKKEKEIKEKETSSQEDPNKKENRSPKEA